MIPFMERELTLDEIKTAVAELRVEGQDEHQITDLAMRERALRNRLEDLLEGGLMETFDRLTKAADHVGCLDEVTRLLAKGLRDVVATTKDVGLAQDFEGVIASLEDSRPLKPEEIASRSPETWIGWTTRATPNAGANHWCFAFEPPDGFTWAVPEALLVWPPLPSISISAVRIGHYDVESWKAVAAAEVPHYPSVALACRMNPISLERVPCFGRTASGHQLEIQLDMEDARDVDRIAVLVRVRPLRAPGGV